MDREGRSLLAIARHDLRRSLGLPPEERYRVALAVAVRAAAAVLAERAQPSAVRRGPCGVWALAGAHDPALREWTEYFAVAAVRPAGSPVTEREADDLLRAAGQFLDRVTARLHRTAG